jgi:ribosomal protein L27
VVAYLFEESKGSWKEHGIYGDVWVEERGTAFDGEHAVASGKEELFAAEDGNGGVAFFNWAGEKGFVGCSDEWVHVDFSSFKGEELLRGRRRERERW